MPTALTKFEVVLPLFADGTAGAIAVSAFVASMITLTPVQVTNIYTNNPDGSISQGNVLFGLLNSTQTSSALGFLNTLNTALALNVVCYTHGVNSQP